MSVYCCLYAVKAILRIDYLLPEVAWDGEKKTTHVLRIRL